MSVNNCGCNHNGSNGSNGTAQQKDYSKMQALTAILNPQTVDRPKKQPKVFLFQSLQNGTVGYEHAEFSTTQQVKSQGYGQGVVGNYGSPSPFTPMIRFGSNIVSMVIDDIVHVYGVNEHTNSICLLSPLYQPLQQSEVSNRLQGKIAGCTNGHGQSWLYFQKPSSNNLTGYIYEKSLTKLNEPATRIGSTEKARLDTDIVAFHDGSRRWIAYQNWIEGDEEGTGTSKIHLACLDDDSLDRSISGSDDVLDDKLIELAACSAVKEGKKLIYIYFRGQEQKVYWSAGESGDKGIQFTRPKPISQATKLDMRSSLALIPDNEGIVIYGVKKNGNGIEAFHDPFIYA